MSPKRPRQRQRHDRKDHRHHLGDRGLLLPCVAGPYTTISCTLRLLKNRVRISTVEGDDGYAHNSADGLPADDARFIESNLPVKAIATSGAQNDSGVFELSFRDERYLPFEGAGAASGWSVELFTDPGAPDFGRSLRQFDYASISDLVVHVKYTAREDAGPFKSGAIAHLRDYFEADDSTSGHRAFNLRQEFPAQWSRFLNPTNPGDGNVFELEMAPALFRMVDSTKTLEIGAVHLLAHCAQDGSYQVVMSPPLPDPPPADANKLKLARVNLFGGLHYARKDVPAPIEIDPAAPPVTWNLRMTGPGGAPVTAEDVTDLVLVLDYFWSES